MSMLMNPISSFLRRIILPGACLLALQCTRVEPTGPTPVQFFLDESPVQFTKSPEEQAMNPTAVFSEGEQRDTLWVAAVSGDCGSGYGLTKGTPYTTANFTSNLGLVGYTYSSQSQQTTPANWTLYPGASDQTLSQSASSRWIPTTDLYYPSSEGYIRFFAYGPQNDASITPASGSDPVLSYTVPEAIANQKGLLVAAPDPIQTPPQLQDMCVPLTMQHVLSGVRFAIDDSENFRLASVTVSGVYDKGNYNMRSGEWSSPDYSVVSPTYTITIPGESYSTYMEGDGAYDRLKSAYTLMMIPQTLPSTARISVTLTDLHPEDSDVYGSFTVDISDQVWQKGKLTTYIIAHDKANLLVIRGMLPDFTEESLDGAW